MNYPLPLRVSLRPQIKVLVYTAPMSGDVYIVFTEDMRVPPLGLLTVASAKFVSTYAHIISAAPTVKDVRSMTGTSFHEFYDRAMRDTPSGDLHLIEVKKDRNDALHGYEIMGKVVEKIY